MVGVCPLGNEGAFCIFASMNMLRPDRAIVKLGITKALEGDFFSMSLAPEYEFPSASGEIVSLGRDMEHISGLSVGDKVLLPFHDMIRVLAYGEEHMYRFIWIEGQLHVECSTFSIVAILTQQIFDQVQGRQKIRVDWATDATPIGNKVFVRLDSQAEQTEAGVIIPLVGRKPSRTGVIVSVGPGANSIFHDGNLLKPGMRVLMPERYSGGDLPFQDVSKEYVVRTNSFELVAYIDDAGEWAPVGGRMMVTPYFPEFEEVDIEEKGVFQKDSRLGKGIRIVGTSILAPDNVRLVPVLCKVVKCGCGYSSAFHPAASAGWDGPMDVSEGDTLLIKRTYTKEGEIIGGASVIEVGGKSMLLLDFSFADAKLAPGVPNVSSMPYDMRMPSSSAHEAVGLPKK